MKVEDIVMVVDSDQPLSIDVIMKDCVESDIQTYSMTWEGCAHDVPLNIMRTSVIDMGVDRDADCCCYGGFKIVSEM